MKKQIKTGVKKDSKYDYAREDISNFDIIENTLNDKKYEYQIAKDVAQNQNKFYNIKDITNQKQDSLSTGWNHHPGSKENHNNIIPSSQNNLNPSQKATQKKISYNEWLEELKRKRKFRGW